MAAPQNYESLEYVVVPHMNEEQFAEVVENYSSFVYNVAYRMISPEDDDDVVQAHSYPPTGLKIGFEATPR